MTLIDKAEALRRIVLTGEQMAGASSSDVVDAIHRDVAALPARGVGVPAEDIDALAYRFWSIHPKDIPEAVGMPEDYKGGKRAWFMATEMRRILAALSPAPVEAQAREAALAVADALDAWADILRDGRQIDASITGLRDMAKTVRALIAEAEK